MGQPGSSESVSAFRLEPLEARQLLSSGQLDPTFASHGRLSSSLLPAAVGLTVQTDGKILTVGNVTDTEFEVTRFDVDGTLDETFGSHGSVTSNAGEGASIAVAPDGKIVVAGASGVRFLVARFNSDGSPDKTFNSTGLQTVDLGAGFLSLAGLSVTVGKANDVYVGGNVEITAGAGTAIVHLNGNGQLDLKYGKRGKIVSVNADALSYLNGIALEPDGRLAEAVQLDGGVANNSFAVEVTPGTPRSSLPRYQLGTGFDGGPAVDSGGRIVVAGADNSATSAFIFRYLPDGTIDPTFAVHTTQFGGGATFTHPVVQSDGKIVVSLLRPAGAFDLVRYNSDGSLDSSFGTNGVVSESGFGNEFAMTVAPSGELVVAGGSTNELDMSRGSGFELDVARYLIPPAPTATFYQALRLRGSQKSYSFVVAYANGGSLKDIDPTTFDHEDVVVTGPQGYNQTASKLLVQNLRRGFLVTYAVPAPSHRWASDNGIYTIHLQPDAVSSNSGAVNSPGDLGQFSLKISPAAASAFVPTASVLGQFQSERKLNDVLI